MKKNILFISHDRSGSNLVRSILSQHPQIYIVPPLPLFEQLYWWMDAYGDLEDDANWQEFLQDLVDLTNANHHALPQPVDFDAVQQAAAAGARTLGAATQAVYALQVASQEVPVGGIKFGANQALLEPFFQQTSFSHVVFNYRDPRDVALSTFKAGVSPLTTAEFCDCWLQWHRTIRQLVSEQGIPMIETRYEDLLTDPKQTLDRVWQFLEVPSYEGALDFHKKDEQIQAAKTSHMWQNLSRPLMRNNFNKFYSEWNPFAVRGMERVLGRGLEEFGYQSAKLWRFRSLWRRPTVRVAAREDNDFHSAQTAVVASVREKHAQRTAKSQSTRAA